MKNELTEADRKAIDKWIEIEHPAITDGMAREYRKTFEAGIKHARANDDPGPEWVASNILEGAAKRIKELEQIHDLEQEENIRLVEVIEDLEDKLKHNAEGWQNAVAEKDKYKDRVKELEAEVSRLQSIFAQLKQALMWKDDFEKDATIMKLIHKGAALQSPSSAKDTPDLTDKILYELEIIDGCTEDIENGHFGRATNVILNSTDKIRDFMAGVEQSSPVSVDINRILREAVLWCDELKLYIKDPSMLQEFINKAKAALSKAKR